MYAVMGNATMLCSSNGVSVNRKTNLHGGNDLDNSHFSRIAETVITVVYRGKITAERLTRADLVSYESI